MNFQKTSIMTFCTAQSLQDAKTCEYYAKSSVKESCMFCRFDYYCDKPVWGDKAQAAAGDKELTDAERRQEILDRVGMI